MTIEVNHQHDINRTDEAGQKRLPVLIVGAGPIGMALALGLAHYGIRSLILDDDDKLCDSSRAVCIQRHTLQIFERLGVVEPMMTKGVTWTLGRVFFGERELFQITFPGSSDEKYPPFINLPQNYTEQYLLEELKKQPLCELRWLHKAVALSHNEQSVTVTAETPQGRRTFEADYLLACDGSRSPVRHMLNLPFVGKTYNDRFLIVDVRTKLDQPNERWFWFDPTFNRGKSALIHPQPDGIYRIDWQLGPDIEVEEQLKPENLNRRIREVIGNRPYEIIWSSIYTFQQRHAEHFRCGRVFLVGDSAHLMSPFGARGMNSGIQDVNNLVWKIALVIQGQASDSLLDSYETERKAAALENLRITDGTMAFITPHSRLRLRIRNAILNRSVRLKRLRKLVNSGRLSMPFTYITSPLISKRLYLPARRQLSKPTVLKLALQFRRGPQAGALAPEARYTVQTENGHSERLRLLDLIGHDFVLFYFSDQPSMAALQLTEASKNISLPLKIYIISQSPNSLAADGTIGGLWDESGEITRTYAAQSGTLYLVRPDGHIAGRGFEFPLVELGQLLARASGQKSTAKVGLRTED